MMIFHFILASLVLTLTAGAAPAKTRELSKTDIQQRIIERAKESLPKGSRIELEGLHLQGPVPSNFVLHDLRPVPPLGALTFQFLPPSVKEKGVSGNVVVRVFAPVAVAKTSLSHNDEFSELNVGFEVHEITPYAQRGFYTDLQSLLALKAKGFIRPGSVIVAMNTQSPAAVIYGQTIELIHQQGSVSVSARVRSLESGKIGDWIRVENPTSRKIMRAKISAPGEATTR